MNLRNRFAALSTVGKLVVVAVVIAGIGILVTGAILGTAVVGTFVLSSGDSVNAAPPASAETTVSPEQGDSAETAQTDSQESTVTATTTESEEAVKSAPSASFQYSASDESGTIQHIEGDSIPADELKIVAGDTEQTWASLQADDGVVETGDSVSVEASSGETIKVVYTGSDDDVVLGWFTA